MILPHSICYACLQLTHPKRMLQMGEFPADLPLDIETGEINWENF